MRRDVCKKRRRQAAAAVSRGLDRFSKSLRFGLIERDKLRGIPVGLELGEKLFEDVWEILICHLEIPLQSTG